jgi:hypothetical protein
MHRFPARWSCALVALLLLPAPNAARTRQASVLDRHLLVTWYGNPHSAQMGILGELDGAARATGLRRQAREYSALTGKTVLMAYHLVAVVAQCTAGNDGKWRRRESAPVIRALLEEARANGFKLILDIQPGRSTVSDEAEALRPFLAEPDVYLALDPEFVMSGCEVPGQHIGQLPAKDLNGVLALLEAVIAQRGLPPKVLIVHQFRLDMLPDKSAVHASPMVDVVVDMDGFGSQSLKHASYRAVMRQGPLEFAGIKLFYRQDTKLFTPTQVMALVPQPSVVVYQ